MACIFLFLVYLYSKMKYSVVPTGPLHWIVVPYFQRKSYTAGMILQILVTKPDYGEPLKPHVLSGFLTLWRKSSYRHAVYDGDTAISPAAFGEALGIQPGFSGLPYIV
jgi:hypothetical protein